MRTVVVVLGCFTMWGIASAAVAQNTLKTWSVAGSVCGVRRVGSEVRRFVATDNGNGLSYDFAPSAAKWHEEMCDRDPNAPPPTLESILARIDKPEPSCAEVQAEWTKLPEARRREIRAINARIGGPDRCDVKP